MERTEIESETLQDVLSRVEVLEPRRAGIDSWKSHGVNVGWLLGSGSFADVHTVSQGRSTSFQKMQSDEDVTNSTFTGSESSVGESVFGKHYEDVHSSHKFAIKRLRKEFWPSEGTSQRHHAVVDFLYEAEILARLPQHKNIIALQAISENFHEEPGRGFLVLEKAQYTLDDRLNEWKRIEDSRKKGPRIPFVSGRMAGSTRLRQLQAKRIRASAQGIAEGLLFLHQNNVVFRDLKPANCAFALDGTVKILDFGLARPYGAGEKRLTGKVGTTRFMAPEVATSQDYSFAADVYSFALLLWQICTLEVPYKKLTTVAEWFEHVVHSEKRPKCKPSCIPSPLLGDLIQKAWSSRPSHRPSFDSICHKLKEEADFA